MHETVSDSQNLTVLVLISGHSPPTFTCDDQGFTLTFLNPKPGSQVHLLRDDSGFWAWGGGLWSITFSLV